MLRLQAANLAFSTEPLRMRSVREQVEMAVCHAGGMVDGMLQAGRPVFLLPMQMEQTMTSRRVEEAGCGLFHISQQGPRSWRRVSSGYSARRPMRSARSLTSSATPTSPRPLPWSG
jgi:hypothetical protein